MRIERIVQTELSPSTVSSAASAPAPRPASTPPPEDVFRYTDKDLTEDGRLPIIIYSQKQMDLERARSRFHRCQNGSKIYTELPLVNGFSAAVHPKDLQRILNALPDGVGVRLNNKIQYPDPRELSSIVKDAPPPPPGAHPGAPSNQGGLDASRATLGIEEVWKRGFTGKGVGIAIIDSGIYPHPDIQDHIKGWVDIADGKPAPYDAFGHGTHVASDAAGSGARSAGKYKGIAPDADLIGVRITTVAEAIKGIQWVIENKDKYNIKVVNMSLGDFATKSYKDDPWSQACEKAIEAGLVVVVAAGNEGPDPGTISTPAINPHVITVGALDDKHTVDRKDDTIAAFSSRGPTSTDNIVKPDIIAPGVGVFGALSPGATLDVPELPHVGKDYIAISGTSMATPMVSGLAAVLLQANPKLSHDDIKKILTSTAEHYLPDDKNVQGAGVVDPLKALNAALAKADTPATTATAPAAAPIAATASPAPASSTATSSKLSNPPALPKSSLAFDGWLASTGPIHSNPMRPKAPSRV